VVYNQRTYGYFSIQSSKWGAMNLLSGTNRRSAGRHNRYDVGYLEQRHGLGAEGWAAATRDLRRIAMKRITDDPAGFLAFALTDKFDVMWCDDGFGAVSVMERRSHEQGPYEVWKSRANRFYFVLIALAVIGLCSGAAGPQRRLYTVMAGGALLVTFVLHLAIEVQPRYHFIMAFVLPLFAGWVLAPETDREGESRLST
jgi:hypothetical protein